MKKLLFVFAIAAFASCNNAAETTTETLSADTTIVTEISTDTTVATTVDTTVAAPAQ